MALGVLRRHLKRRLRAGASAARRGALRCLEGLGSLLAAPSRGRGRRSLQVSSPCAGSVTGEALEAKPGSWHGFCPCCKRPVCLEPGAELEVGRPGREVSGRYAYVIVLWGTKPDYILGAMVLARSLQRTGTQHDRVVLHTPSVGPEAVGLLARTGWQPQEVQPVVGVKELYNNRCERFDEVFTKLRALGLVEYEKVLVLDIDTLVFESLDQLFELPAPAALIRGPLVGRRCGDPPMRGRKWFMGSGGSWGQAGGINAGVMLWEPSWQVMQQMLGEVTCHSHPSHIRGNGPEQDYLSRYWAGRWTHIGVEHNFQLDQMYYALNPTILPSSDRGGFLTDGRLPGAGIRLVHYSGKLKPWARVLDPAYDDGETAAGDAGEAAEPAGEADECFVRAMLESLAGYWMWVLRDPETVAWKVSRENMVLGPDGKFHWIPWGRAPPEGWSAEALGEAIEIPQAAIDAAEAIVRWSLAGWREVYDKLSEELGGDLAARVRAACAAGAPRPEADEKRGEPPAQQLNGYDCNTARGWHAHGGWCVNGPVLASAAVLACCLPTPLAAMSLRGRAVFHLQGAAAVGLHVAAITAEGAVDVFCGEDDDVASLAAWSARVPAGAWVLAALVGLQAEEAARALKPLWDAGLGLPLKAPPGDCPAAAIMGRLGEPGSYESMAAADVAVVSAAVGAAAGKSGYDF